ncbi:phosphoenolpyruvate--protein phosphotransferase [Oscillospiraceae bacterium 44-34]
MAVTYQGVSISPGAALGRVLVVQENSMELPQYKPVEPAAEIERFRQCHGAAIQETREMLEKARAGQNGDAEGILDAQLTLLMDEYAVVEPIEEAIVQEGLNLFQAAGQVFEEIAETFRQADDEYMSQRAADVEDICGRFLSRGLGLGRQDYSSLPQGTVLAARSLTPSDTIGMDLEHVAAIITEYGGYCSHVGIITRNHGIPSVSGLEGIVSLLQAGEEVLVDGDEGAVTAGLGESEREAFYILQRQREARERALDRFRTAESRAADGEAGLICANIGSEAEAAGAAAAGADGIGLLRSEFLYMGYDQLPDEESQFRAYRRALEDMAGRPVTIRTLDIGGDKELPALPMEREENPFLGCRAIRLCLSHPDLFHTQLRALLRASVYGRLQILFPMISCLEELRQAKGLLLQVREELEQEGIPTAPVQVGMMVEVPSAALLAGHFAQEVDFFSIGTNDLIQYALACERGSAKVEHLYSPYHPAVLRLIALAAEGAREAGIECGMCGEAAADPRLLPLFWGMGVREFSMTPAAVTRARAVLSGVDTAACRELARRALDCGDVENVIKLLEV